MPAEIPNDVRRDRIIDAAERLYTAVPRRKRMGLLPDFAVISSEAYALARRTLTDHAEETGS